MRRNRTLQFLFALYCVLLIITLWRHEMWRDELQAWNIATSSAGITDLFHNIRYEGHPALWFIILWLLSKISHAPEMMQVINFIFSGITAWLILFRSPFFLLEKALLIFGYYFFYEYAAISRNYMIEVMMVAVICVLWNQREKYFGWLLLLLFLLCQTNSYGYIISIAFAFAFFIDTSTRKQNGFLKGSLFLVTSVSGFMVAYLTSAPPEDSEFYLPIHISFDEQRFIQVFSNFWNAFIPVPRFQLPFWSEPLFKSSLTICVLGLCMLAAIIIFSVGKRKLLFTFLLPAFAGMLAFAYFKYPGFQRHYGHVFIAFVAFLWMGKSESANQDSKRIPSLFFSVILLIQFIAGVGFTVADWWLPFSNGKSTASYIRNNFPENIPVAGVTDCPMVTIAGYLQHDVVFLNNLRHSSFVVYKRQRLLVEDSDVVRNLFSLADSSGRLITVLNFNLQLNGKNFLPTSGKDTVITFGIHGAEKKFDINNKAQFEGAMVGGENYTVYEISREN